MASELASDVERIVPDGVRVAHANNHPIRLRRISASSPPASWEYPAEVFYEIECALSQRLDEFIFANRPLRIYDDFAIGHVLSSGV